MSRPFRTSSTSVLALLIAGLILLATPATGEGRADPPLLQPTPDVVSRLAEAAQDSTLAPWQREFMLDVVRGGHEGAALEPSAGLPAIPLTSAGIAAADGAWTQVPPPSGRSRHDAIYDPVRDRMVVFGGWDGRFLNDVWALSLSGSPAWSVLALGEAQPPRRWGHTAIYDPVRDRMVVFGGYDGSFRNDVWALSLSGSPAWSALAPAGASPTAREAHTAIYDPVRDRMVVFGGAGASGVRDDVWVLTFSGSSTWSALASTGAPPTARHSHTAIYDPMRDRMLVFGGWDGGGRPNDVLALTLSGSAAWSALASAGTPPAGRDSHTSIYDSARDRMVVFGGWGTVGGYLNDAWALSLSGSPAWTDLASTGVPPTARHSHAAIYHSMHDRIVVFGGIDGDRPNDVWALALLGSPAWSILSPAPPLVGRRSHAGIYDPVGDRMVVFGGQNGGSLRNDVWALSLSGSTSWSKLVPAGSPPIARNAHTAIYDPVRQRMVVFGGCDTDGRCNDVWALSLAGSPAWSSLAPVGTPPTAREGPTAVYDPVRDRMVVFGGLDGLDSYRNDVWELSLSGSPTWSALAPAGIPPTGRSFHTAIYDPVRDRMVIFAGVNFDYPNDVWALSLAGSPAWSVIAPGGSSPSSRYGHTAIYDPVRDRMVVFGGNVGGNDAWTLTLSGSPTWSKLAPANNAPSGRYGHAAIYDPMRDRMVVFGGWDNFGDENDVWVLGWGNPPVPVLVSLAHAEAEPGRVSLTWYGSESAGLTASVERREVTTVWERLATISADGTGMFRYDDRSVAAGARYAYRLGFTDDAGAETVTAESWVDVPRTVSYSLEGLRPNPSGAELVAVFALPDDAPADLALIDITGRRVLARDVGSLGAGRHTLRLAPSGELPTGVYWLRLERMGRVRLAKAIILR